MRSRIKYITYENILNGITTMEREAEIRITASKKDVYGGLEDTLEYMSNEIEVTGYKTIYKSLDDRKKEGKLIVKVKNKYDYENIKQTYDRVKTTLS